MTFLDVVVGGFFIALFYVAATRAITGKYPEFVQKLKDKLSK